jgi:hypothetical protein
MSIVGRPGEPNVKTVTIASGASLSGAVDLEGYTLVGILMPAAWTAAALTFAVASTLAGTYADAYTDAGVEVSATVAASRYVGLRSDLAMALAAARFLKVRSGTTGTPVNQGDARILTLVLKE